LTGLQADADRANGVSVHRSAGILAADSANQALRALGQLRSLAAAFLRTPLYSTQYARAFGTLYTAVYRPSEGAIEYRWPTSSWRRTFDDPDATFTVQLGRDAATRPRRDDDDRAGNDGSRRRRGARSTGDPQAFGELLDLTHVLGAALGDSARALAGASSWAQVGDVAGPPAGRMGTVARLKRRVSLRSRDSASRA
jgi:hypothetical protein